MPDQVQGEAVRKGGTLAYWPKSPWVWLLAGVLAYIALSFTLSGLRLIEFQTSNYDLGLFQQALWSSAHGRGFFESADFSLDGASSLLRIHPALSLFALSELYALSPTPWTLFAAQSILAGAAAIPLFLLARDVTGSPRRGLAAALLYLAWTPTLASNLFDFHLEVVLPVELFAFFLLWRRGRYVAGFLVALLAMLSFEAGAAFVFLTGVFFLFPSVRSLWRRRHPGWPGRPTARPEERTSLPDPSAGSIPFRSRPEIASAALLVTATVTFILLLGFEASFGSQIATSPPISFAGVLQGGPPQLPLSWDTLHVDLVAKVTFWLLLYALVAFIPLWAPRTAILSVPWIVASLFGPSKYTFLGSHYGFLYAFPIFVGVAYGLRSFPEDIAKLVGRSPAPETGGVDPAGVASGGRRRSPIPWVVLLATLLSINLVLGPADPLAQNSSAGNGYHLSYTPPPGFAATRQLVSLIPPGASLLASDDLMPLLANDVNAYGIFYEPASLPYLPYDLQNLPAFVALSEAQLGNVPPWLVSALTYGAGYSLRATVGDTAAGMILLFERGYVGPRNDFGPRSFTSASYTWPALSVGVAARILHDPPNTGLVRIESMSGLTGNVWYGPYIALPAGEYAVTLTLRAASTDSTLLAEPNVSVLEVDSSGFASPILFKSTYSWGTLSGGQWTQIRFHLQLAAPVPRVEVRGYQLDSRISVELSGLEIAPS